MRRERNAAERDLVAVMQNAIDMRGRKMHGLIAAIVEIRSAAGLDNRNIGRHDLIFRMRLAQNLGAARAVVVMRVANEKNLDVAPMQSKRLDAFANERRRRVEIAIDEDVAGRRDDEIGCEIFAADVVQIAGNPESRKWLGPLGIGIGCNARREEQRESKGEKCGGLPDDQWDSVSLASGWTISRAFSRCTPREPLTRAASPRSRFCLSHSPAAVASDRKIASAPAALAASTRCFALPRTPTTISICASAAAFPQAECSAGACSPSSSISPAMRILRFAGYAASVRIIDCSASGLEL